VFLFILFSPKKGLVEFADKKGEGKKVKKKRKGEGGEQKGTKERRKRNHRATGGEFVPKTR